MNLRFQYPRAAGHAKRSRSEYPVVDFLREPRAVPQFACKAVSFRLSAQVDEPTLVRDGHGLGAADGV